jgi:hypothetical protein
VNGQTTFGAFTLPSFTYSSARTPVITTALPALVSSAVTNLITITGSGFIPDPSTEPSGAGLEEIDAIVHASFTVTLGDRTCDVVSATPTVVVCRLARAAPPNLHTSTNARSPLLYIGGLGYASNDNNQQIDVALRVQSISTQHGSLAGGSLITITGAGFKPQPRLITDTSLSIDPEYISVRLAVYTNSTGQPLASPSGPFLASGKVVGCSVVSYTMFEVVCRTQDVNVSASDLGVGGSLVALLAVSINNVPSVCGAASDSACQFEFRSDDTASIASISPLTGVAGDVLTITGTLLASPPPTVLIGHEVCTVLTSSATQITCTVPPFTTATFPVNVVYGDGSSAEGFAESRPKRVTFTFGLGVSSIDISSGSSAGGALVTATGSGFSPRAVDNVVTVGGVPAYVVTSTATNVTFFTPAAVGGASAVAAAAGGVLASSVSVTVKSYYALKDFWSPDIVLANIPTGVYPLASTKTAALAAPFSYDASLTSSLTAVSPLTGSSGAVLTLTGSGFGASQGASKVYVGGVECVVSAFADASITCTLGTTPAGQHAVLVSIGTNGYSASATPFLFTSALTISSVAPLSGGYGGGVLLTVTGSGFSGVTGEDSVNVCNAKCLVQSASYGQITCLTTPLVTLDRLNTFGPTLVFQAKGVTTGSTGAAANQDYAALFDGNVETGFLSTGSGCDIRLDTGASTNLALTRIRFYPTYRQARATEGATFYASQDGVTWTKVGTATGVLESWNMLDILDTNTPKPTLTQSYRYFSFRSSTTCKLQELEFQGYRVSSVETVATANDAVSCPITVQVNSTVASSPAGSDIASAPVVASSANNFAYSLSKTPTVIAILPVYASALGGETVTLTGTGFVASQPAAHEVMLNDYPCAVQTVNAAGTEITCVTGARISARPAPSGREISVRVINPSASAPSGFALLVPNPAANVSPLANQALPPVFRYLDKWSALTTWRFQEPPVDGDTVVIPQGQAVLLDVSPPKLFFLLIQGVLIFDEKDLALDASYIYVQGGLLQIGTETKPFTHNAVITLHGDRYKSIELPHFGSKVLVNGPISYNMVEGVGAVPINPLAKFGHGVDPSTLPQYYSDNWDGRGRLDMHGIPRVRTWTKVSTTALRGTSTLTTSEDVDFAPGETLVITSHKTWSQTERRVVASLAADNRTLTFTEPLDYDHVSEQWDFDNGAHHVDMRYEVGILSRNIIVQGDDNSDRQSFGGHIMSLKGGIMRVENIEIRKMGQSFNLGRYSIHFHLADQVPESYIRSNSIHDAFQRACTVHGSHYARVQNNVAAYIRGHSIFVEDGNERYNVIEANLVAHTTRLTSMLRSDTKPASFWTSSPENFWRHNVAAGCINDGYWLELPGSPGGPSFSTTICPVHGHLGEVRSRQMQHTASVATSADSDVDAHALAWTDSFSFTTTQHTPTACTDFASTQRTCRCSDRATRTRLPLLSSSSTSRASTTATTASSGRRTATCTTSIPSWSRTDSPSSPGSSSSRSSSRSTIRTSSTVSSSPRRTR